MSNTTYSQVTAALKDAIYQMNGTNVPTEIPANHIYPSYSAANATSKDEDYPKVMVALDSAKTMQQPGRAKSKVLTYDVIFIVKKTSQYTDPAEQQAEQLMEDFETTLDNNTTLGGLVENATVLDMTTDSGFANPEGLVVAKVQVEYRAQR